MRAGVGHPSAAALPEHGALAPETLSLQKRIVSIFCAMAERALRDAGRYVIHEGRRVVTREDTVRGLKHQARTFLDTLTPEDVDQVHDDLFGGASSSSCSDDGDDESDYDDVSSGCSDSDGDDTMSEGEESEEDVGKGEKEEEDVVVEDAEEEVGERCACAWCESVRAHEATWATWEPHEEILIRLKACVDSTAAEAM